ncbi:hypothetical protein Cgig2_024693 [Carnegiea gigantea]|uniref:Uncharacterized protein n=1 Tax=Carnegiea gigantea TaxID=171969 RepID=A0A9Q1JVZ7_9CARY|nr:hypothetical protein Cgig2_024693 [Carnegiea gigantea]
MNLQFSNANVEESVSEDTNLMIIRTKSWGGLLKHRMAPGGFLRLVERLQYEQWLAIVNAGFGGILSIRTKLIPKSLARWLLEKYDPWDNSLSLANGKLLIDEEDVHATLGLPMGEFEVNEGCTSDDDMQFLDDWRRRWHVKRVVEWKKDKTKFFTGSLLFLMLFYMDRVQFRGRKVERSFPVAIEWDIDKVRSRDKDEQLSGGYGKGRILERIDY